jgi:hypothetical protein
MNITLSNEEVEILLKSLESSKHKVENLPVPGTYPTIEFRSKTVTGITDLIAKIKSSRK